jgi:hypothetical protein
MFRDEYTDPDSGDVFKTVMSREYYSLHLENTALDGAFSHYSMFVEHSYNHLNKEQPYINYDYLDKGIVQVMLRLGGFLILVIVDDYLPCLDG